jgi:hypothetical protein
MEFFEIIRKSEEEMTKLTEKNERHFFVYHINYRTNFGFLHPFIQQLALVLYDIDQVYQGYALEMIGRITRCKGQLPDRYEELLTMLAEIHVTHRAIIVADEVNGEKIFVHEPRSHANGKNPEFRSCTNGIYYAVEVKAPKLLKHQQMRSQGGIQYTSRWNFSPFGENVEHIIYPRDNPIKDFLISAQAKFNEYVTIYPDDFRLLFIVWDDYIYEPISALQHPSSGLFTSRSFARDEKGQPLTFDLVDGVIILRHLHQFKLALAEQELINDIVHPFQYVNKPFPCAFIQNPHGRKVPDILLDEFIATSPDGLPGSEYQVTDIVFWNRF